MKQDRFLAMLSIAILIPIALGATYAVATGGEPGRARVVSSNAADSVTVPPHASAVAYRIARAKCGRLVGVDRGNCRTEALAEAKRALRISRPGPSA